MSERDVYLWQKRIEELAKKVREEEVILYPRRWVYIFLMTLPALIIIGLSVLALTVPRASITYGDWIGYTFFSLICIGIIYLANKPLNRKRFATRLNACGLMSLHKGDRYWCSWDKIENIRAVYSTSDSGQERINGIEIRMQNSDRNYRRLPSNYSISDEAMLDLIYKFRNEYKKFRTDDFYAIEKLVSKDPPEIYLNKSWGRSKNS